MDLSLAEDCGPLPDEYALSVFRIAQEAMNNAAQHGQATHIQMKLKCDNSTLRLEVQDDGTGFSPPDDWHTLAEEDHYGLLGMRERAGAIGATLDIDSAPGSGTRVGLQSAMDASPTADDLAESPLPA
jgi:signal transduction histidine kinase